MAAALGTRPDDRRGTLTAAIAGIVFAVLFVAAWLVSLDTPEYDAGDQAWVGWFDDSGNRAQHVFSAFAMTVASLAFVVFLAGWVRRLNRASPDPGGQPWIPIGAGLVFAAMTMVAGTTVAAASLAVEFAPNDFPVPDADVLRMTEQLGVGIGLLGAGWAAALFVGASSWSARRTAALPGWLVIAGYVAAVLLLGSITFVLLAVLPLWVLAVSITMIRSRARDQASVAA